MLFDVKKKILNSFVAYFRLLQVIKLGTSLEVINQICKSYFR